MKLRNMAELRAYLKDLEDGEVKAIERPSSARAIKDKCKDCMSNYVDGRLDCEIPGCSLYYWMPYGQLVISRRNKRKELRLQKAQMAAQ